MRWTLGAGLLELEQHNHTGLQNEHFQDYDLGIGFQTLLASTLAFILLAKSVVKVPGLVEACAL